jgi:metallo-beta-lactamase family protein
MRVTFHGAAGCVTGSKFLVESGGERVLVDCGLFQGLKNLRERNWERLPFDVRDLSAVLLTHAHVDHSGYLPRVVREGFSGPVYATRGTRELCGVLLPDAARLQEEDADLANLEGFSKHHPALPLYDAQDAEQALALMRDVPFDKWIEIGGFRARYSYAGHILGAASIELQRDGLSVLFSGDLGRPLDPIMRPPAHPDEPDWIVLESTYGDRLHPATDALVGLAEALTPTLERGGVVLIASFAVGRAQTLLFALHRLFESGQLPRVPVHVDSPMAGEATALFKNNPGLHRLDGDQAREVCAIASYARTPKDSKAINRESGPRIVISASGMLTGGRVLHHLKVYGPHAENLILLPGYQAPGTRGADLAAGAREVRVHGRWLPILAAVRQLELFSAHADQHELLAWLRGARRPPRGVILAHGEPAAADALRHRIAADFAGTVRVAELGETIDLSRAEPPRSAREG